MRTSLGLSALSLASLALSSPIEARDGNVGVVNSLYCLVVTDVVSALHAYPSATPYCSSYLGIKTQTATSTSYSTTTLTSTTGTNTVTAPDQTVTVTETASVTTCILSAAKAKRTSPAKGPVISTSTSIVFKSLPPQVATCASPALSTACSCLSIPTPTTTVTVYPTITSVSNVAATTTTTATDTATVTTTTTITACPTADVSCSNAGIQWAYFKNVAGNNIDSQYSTFDPTAYKTENPTYVGTTTSAGGINFRDGSPRYIYGSTEAFPSDYFVLNHRSYLFAVQTGTYTINTPSPDDLVAVWLGDSAYSGYTRNNANIVIAYGHSTASYQFNLVAGSYTPFRIMFAQGQGDAKFSFSVQAPDGTTILDSTSQNSPYLVQYSCDGVAAPKYMDFGKET